MILYLLELRCDLCKESNITTDHDLSPEPLRKMAEELGWRHGRRPHKDGTSVLDICPSCQR